MQNIEYLNTAYTDKKGYVSYYSDSIRLELRKWVGDFCKKNEISHSELAVKCGHTSSYFGATWGENVFKRNGDMKLRAYESVKKVAMLAYPENNNVAPVAPVAIVEGIKPTLVEKKEIEVKKPEILTIEDALEIVKKSKGFANVQMINGFILLND